MSSFPVTKLGQVAEFINGDRGNNYPSGDDFVDDGVPFINAGHLADGKVDFSAMNYITENRFNLLGNGKTRRNDILYCLRGSLGKTAIVRTDQNAAIASSLVILRASDQCSVDYLYHFLTSPLGRTEIGKFDNGSSQPNLSANSVKNYLLPLPPLAEQRRIAEVLDRAEALRAKRRAALAQLDSLTQSLFLDLFGDPATNPKSWPKATLGDVTEMVTGYPFRSEEYVTNGDSVRLCRGANILPGRVDWTDLARWPESKAAGLAAFNLEAGDVVIAMDRPWISEGFKIARVQPEDCPALLVQRVARLRGKKEIPNAFLFHLLNQPAFTRHCRPTETTIPHISPKDIRSFSFPVPPIPLQREFARRVTAVEALKTAQRASLAELDALFASLQHHAFRGEL